MIKMNILAVVTPPYIYHFPCRHPNTGLELLRPHPRQIPGPVPAEVANLTGYLLILVDGAIHRGGCQRHRDDSSQGGEPPLEGYPLCDNPLNGYPTWGEGYVFNVTVYPLYYDPCLIHQWGICRDEGLHLCPCRFRVALSVYLLTRPHLST